MIIKFEININDKDATYEKDISDMIYATVNYYENMIIRNYVGSKYYISFAIDIDIHQNYVGSSTIDKITKKLKDNISKIIPSGNYIINYSVLKDEEQRYWNHSFDKNSSTTDLEKMNFIYETIKSMKKPIYTLPFALLLFGDIGLDLYQFFDEPTNHLTTKNIYSVEDLENNITKDKITYNKENNIITVKAIEHNITK